MCRWIAYIGSPVYMEDLITKPGHSLIDQSLASREGFETTNGDGFGVGWYSEAPEPGVYKSIEPAWNDRNLRQISKHIRSHLFMAHVRATTGTPIQRTNCHPFCHGEWMLLHNGAIQQYNQLRRDMAFAVEPALYPTIEGTTDSELMFKLALTYGLADDPIPALERMTGFVEKLGRRHGVENPVQMTLGLSDGKRLIAVRYSSEHRSRTLYHSRRLAALKEFYPELDEFSDDSYAIVSEPLSEMSELWQSVPESSAVIVDSDGLSVQPFTPRWEPGWVPDEQ